MSSELSNGIAFERENVRGFLHKPANGCQRGLVLTHGAGGNCDTPILVAVARTLESLGICVLRCDLPFRQRRASGPPSPSTAALDRAGLRAAVESLQTVVQGDIFLGGHSYGGRQSSILAAEDRSLVKGLLLLSYPLHPPDKPTQLRTAHFPNLNTPTVFVHGTGDPFGTLAELTLALDLIPAPKRLLPVEGAGHDLKRGRFDIASAAKVLFDLAEI